MMSYLIVPGSFSLKFAKAPIGFNGSLEVLSHAPVCFYGLEQGPGKKIAVGELGARKKKKRFVVKLLTVSDAHPDGTRDDLFSRV